MRIKILLILLLAVTFNIKAQETDSTYYKWIPSLVTGVNVSQVALSNWAKGGENTLSLTFLGDFNLNYNSPQWMFTNQLKGTYGRSKIGSSKFKTNENDLYLESVLSHKFGWAVDPYVSNTVRTQVSVGYEYDGENETKVSNIFDPAYITQSIGFKYEKSKQFITRLGLAFQEVVTSKYNTYSDDPETLDEVEKFKFETGLESVTSTELTVDDNVLLKSKLRLFTRFEDLDVWDLRWDNTLTAKVNKWLNVNLSVLVVYQKSESVKTQMKEALQLGITYTIF